MSHSEFKENLAHQDFFCCSVACPVLLLPFEIKQNFPCPQCSSSFKVDKAHAWKTHKNCRCGLKYHFVGIKSTSRLWLLWQYWQNMQSEKMWCGGVCSASSSCKLNIQSFLFHLCQWFPQPGFSGFKSANLLLSSSLARPLGPALNVLYGSQQLLKSGKACGWLNHLSYWFMELEGHFFMACKWFCLEEKYKRRNCRWPLY